MFDSYDTGTGLSLPSADTPAASRLQIPGDYVVTVKFSDLSEAGQVRPIHFYDQFFSFELSSTLMLGFVDGI